MKLRNPFQSATEKVISTSEENRLYEKVTTAIENNDIDKGVWTKAFTQADGDTTKQKVIYIELMVEHYKNLMLAEQELQEARLAEEVERKQIAAAEQRKKAIKAERDKEAGVAYIISILGFVIFFCVAVALLTG